MARGREVDCHEAARPLEARVAEGSTDASQRLADRHIREPDQMDLVQTVHQVDLDPDQVGVDSQNRSRKN